MPIGPDDKLQNGEVSNDDNYDKLNVDILFLIDKLRIWKEKIGHTPWYRIGTHIKLRKELSGFEKEVDEIAERLQRLHAVHKNPIEVVRRV